MFVYKINDTMYQRDIALCFNGTQKEMGGYIKRRFNLLGESPTSEGEFSKITGNDGSKSYLIYIESFNWLVKEYGLLAHEVVHCVHRILKDLGFTLTDSSVEAYCYYYQRIFQECIRGISSKQKVVK